MLKSAWAALSPIIKNVINEAGSGTFFEALSNHETHEYKDLQLLLTLPKRFWDTTYTFHFSNIGEVMLTPYDQDLQLLLALAKRFWDTTCTFHFSNIGEVMLTPYDFFVITGLRLGGKRILINDSFTSIKLKKLPGVMPSRMRSNNVPLSYLCESIPQCETMAKGACMLMLLFIGIFLCPDLGSIVNLRYLGELEKN